MSGSVSAGSAARIAWAVARRPTLWRTAATQVRRLAAPRWWRRAPFLPVPEQEYLRFRLETAYGDDRDPEPQDVLAYLEWCRAWSRVSRSNGPASR